MIYTILQFSQHSMNGYRFFTTIDYRSFNSLQYRRAKSPTDNQAVTAVRLCRTTFTIQTAATDNVSCNQLLLFVFALQYDTIGENTSALVSVLTSLSPCACSQNTPASHVSKQHMKYLDKQPREWLLSVSVCLSDS